MSLNRDIDSNAGTDLTDFSSFRTTQASATYVGSALQQNNFSFLPAGFTTYAVNPATTGDPTNWIDEGNMPSTDTNYEMDATYTNFTSGEMIFGYTGPATANTTNRGSALSFTAPAACISTDTDGDGTPDHLDLDSDNDGCPDALEGGGSFTSSQLVTASGAISSQSPNSNFGTVVDGNGVPTATGTSGQTAGTSTNSAAQDPACALFGIDADNDGIADVNDLDDDNDGILDSVEQYHCYTKSSSTNTAPVTNPAGQSVSGKGIYRTSLAFFNWPATITNGTSATMKINGVTYTATISNIAFTGNKAALNGYQMNTYWTGGPTSMAFNFYNPASVSANIITDNKTDRQGMANFQIRITAKYVSQDLPKRTGYGKNRRAAYFHQVRPQNIQNQH